MLLVTCRPVSAIIRLTILLSGAVCLLSKPGDAQVVLCYSAAPCTANSLIANVTSTRDCCLGRREDGMFYGIDGSCVQCNVYGFDIPGQPLDSPSFTAVESNNQKYSLPVRIIKGSLGHLQVVDFDAEVLPGGTAVEGKGTGDDFFIDNNVVQITPGTETPLRVTFREDSIALESEESFRLRLSTDDPVPTGDNFFFVNTLDINIKDSEGVEITFTEADYAANERSKELVVALQITGTRATPVTVKVIPMNYDEFGKHFPWILSLHEHLPEFNDKSPNRATEEDFSTAELFVMLPATPPDQSKFETIFVSIPIIDDGINENMNEVFAVIVELVDAVDSSRVNFSPRNASLCGIRDNDPIQIGFEFSSYTYTESDDVINDPTRTDVQSIYLIKSIESEQTFDIVVSTNVIAGAQDATHNIDYSIGDDKYILEFGPNQERVLLPLTLFDDSLPEGPESAQLVISQQNGSVANFLLSVNATITLFIEDDGDPVYIELLPDSAVVMESVGLVEFCLRVTVPGIQHTLPYAVQALLETNNGSAGEGDYVPITAPLQIIEFDDNTRFKCFNVTIIDDTFVELAEDFTLTVSTFDPEVLPVQVMPNVSLVTILDNDAMIDCLPDVYGGILWPRTMRNEAKSLPCSTAGEFYRVGPLARRQCNNVGEWVNADFTGCTLKDVASEPFVVLWMVVLDADNVEDWENVSIEGEKKVAKLLTGFNITFSKLMVTVLPLPLGSMTLTVTATLTSAIIHQSNLIDFLNTVISELSVLGPYSVSDSGRGTLRIIPSETCQCSSHLDESFPILYLCGKASISPCTCPSKDNCMCQSPFVGDGRNCTLDSDGDGFPDTPLTTCSGLSMQTYCIQDVCPDVSDPEQNPINCQTMEIFDGCHYGPDKVWNVTWANTRPGRTDTQRCPGGINTIGMATRVCGEDGTWIDPPNVLQCQALAFVAINEKIIDLVTADEPEQLIAAITTELAMATELPDGISLLPLDLNTTNFIISNILDVSETMNVTADEHLLQVFDNVLYETNSNGWSGLQAIGAGSQTLMDNAERYGFLLAKTGNGTDNVLSRSNIVLQAKRYLQGSNGSLEFPQRGDLVNYTIDDLDVPPARVEIPVEVLQEELREEGSDVPVVNILFKNLEKFLPSSAVELPQSVSGVISVQVGNQRSRSQAFLGKPVNFYFTFDKGEGNLNYRCVFWNFSQPVGSGHWASAGVQAVDITTKGNTTTVQCDSTHLTSFAILVGGQPDASEAESEALKTVSYVGCAISVVCLTLTILFFLYQGKMLLVMIHNFIHLNLAIALLLGYLLFLGGIETATGSTVVCALVAALLQYFFLAAFCWMLCEGLYLFLMLVVVFSTLPSRWWLFLLIGWVTPIPIVAIAVGLRHDYYGTREDGDLEVCWLSTEKGTIWAFVGPMLLIIAANTVFFVLAMRALWKNKRSRQARNPDCVNTIRLATTLLQGAIILLPLLGLTWAFGILTLYSNTTVFAWIFTFFNSLQGLAILSLHVIRNEKVWSIIRPRLSNLRKIITTSTAGKYEVSTSVTGSGRGQKNSLKQSIKKTSSVELGALPRLASSSVSTHTSEITWEAMKALDEESKTSHQ